MRRGETAHEAVRRTHRKQVERTVADAEMMFALRFANGQCGSLKEAGIREEVCQIMEGGRKAFARRYRRFGREPGDV